MAGVVSWAEGADSGKGGFYWLNFTIPNFILIFKKGDLRKLSSKRHSIFTFRISFPITKQYMDVT